MTIVKSECQWRAQELYVSEKTCNRGRDTGRYIAIGKKYPLLHLRIGSLIAMMGIQCVMVVGFGLRIIT
jgi:hypothetical protein